MLISQRFQMFFSQMVSKKSQEINIFPYFSIFFVDFKLIYFCFSNFSTVSPNAIIMNLFLKMIIYLIMIMILFIFYFS